MSPTDEITFDDFDDTIDFEKAVTSDVRLIITQSGGVVDVKLRVAEKLEFSVAAHWFDGKAPEPRILYRLDYADSKMSIYPQISYYSEELYGQKYGQIKEIQLVFDNSTSVPTDTLSAIEILDKLPSCFIKRPEFGLGLVMEMRPLILAIENIKGITRIAIGEFKDTYVEGDTFYFDETEFNALRSGMSRITRHYQAESLQDRVMLAHNAALHRVNPNEYQFKERPYEPGTIFKLLGGTQVGNIRLRGKDRVGILTAISKNAVDIAKRDPKEFVQLQKDIELVSLDQLIDAFQVRLRQNSGESAWQKLLELNPFILSMLFGQPIVVLQSSASVGGQTITGGGTKIADFLTKNPLTQNAAIVELKKPNTPLIGQEYRSNVFAPSQELMGSIVQVLDQRLKLVTDVAGIRYRSKSTDLEVFAVECVVVAGRIPIEEAKRSSFEIMRSQMKDIRIVTFDELLERLHLLRELLAGERYVSTIGDEEDEEAEWGRDFESTFDDEDRDPRD
jgi:hypothetical protein